MAYNPNPTRQVRDQAYPSQIAAERPICAPRIHCEEQPNPNASLLGGTHAMHGEEMKDRWQHELRAGHGFRNENDPDDTGHRERTLKVEGDGY